MTYTVTNLITDAFATSGVVSRDLQTVKAGQISNGLVLLNMLLDMTSARIEKIPYFKGYNFNAIPGQETYFIPGLVAVETLTFNIQSVRYSMTPIARRSYQGTSRANNVTSLPFSYNIERAFVDGVTGSEVRLYFPPESNYPMTLWGKFALVQVTLGQDMDAITDRYYNTYLKYGLADLICADYDLTTPDRVLVNLSKFEIAVTNVGYPDLALQKSSCFSRGGTLTYAQVNLGSTGWAPP